MLVLADEDLLISRDDSATWASMTSDLVAPQELTSLTAPLGLDPGAPLLVGRVNGEVLTLLL